MRKNVVVLVILSLMILSIGFNTLITMDQLVGSNVSKSIVFDQFEIVWENVFFGETNESACKMIQTLDGGSLLAGYSEFSNTSSKDRDMYLLKTDDNGSKEWEIRLGESLTDYVVDVIQINNSYLVLGVKDFNSSESFTTDSNCWISYINNTGHIEWEKTIGNSGAILRPVKILLDIDDLGNFLLFFDKLFFDRSLVIKMHENGTSLWNKSLGTRISCFGDIIHSSNGSYFIVRENCITKLNSSFEIEWTQVLLALPPTLDFTSIHECKDGSFILSGSHDGYFLFYKIDSEGELLSNTIYNFGFYSQIGYSIVEHENNFLIAGVGRKTMSPLGDRDIIIGEFTDNGTLISQIIISTENSEFAYSLCTLPITGEFLLGGNRVYDITGSDLLLIKFRKANPLLSSTTTTTNTITSEETTTTDDLTTKTTTGETTSQATFALVTPLSLILVALFMGIKRRRLMKTQHEIN